LLYQGEFLPEGKPVKRTRRVENPREAAAYTFGYNPTLFARRAHDVLSVLAYAKHHEPSTTHVDLVGLAGTGPWATAARAQARDAVRRAAIDTGGFRFGQILDIHDPGFLPGGAKYGDLPAMLAVAAPADLWLAGEGKGGRLVRAAYRANQSVSRLTVCTAERPGRQVAAVSWLLQD
jgi:hypothetical protein